VNRFPIAFAQTVAFAAATGSMAWQILRILIHRGAILSPVVIALIIAGAFAAGAALFALVLAPARARMSRSDAGGHPYPPRLLILNIAISTVWMLAWAMPAIQFVALGGADTFWAFVCFSMGGLSGALFYEPIGSSRTPV
jgi:hypothetical protein